MVRTVHADHTVLSPSDAPPTQPAKKRQLAGIVHVCDSAILVCIFKNQDLAKTNV